MRTIAWGIAFIAAFTFIDWLAGVTAPVMGPVLMLGILAFLVYIIVQLVKAGR